jgi:hypothetical protein
MRVKELNNIKSTKTRKLKTKNKKTRKKKKKGGSGSDQKEFNKLITKKENTIDDAKMVFTIFDRACNLSSYEYDKKRENVMNRNFNDSKVRDENTLYKEFSDNSVLRSKHGDIAYKKLLKLGELSDHKPLFFKNNDPSMEGISSRISEIYNNENVPAIFTWNTLHHEGFNKDFIEPNQNDNFLTATQAKKLDIMSENKRYNNIADIIIEYMKNKEFECISLQECEFAIYKKILGEIDTCSDKNEYYSQYYPRKIRLGEGGTRDEDFDKKDKQLDIKSYGNAIFIKKEKDVSIKTEALNIGTYGKETEKRDKTLKYKIDIKVVKSKKGNNTYSSVHIPCMGKNPSPNSLQYLESELGFLLKDVEKMNDNDKLWLIGDFNLSEKILTEELKKHSNNKVDIIFVKSGSFYGKTYSEYDGSGSTPNDHIILCVKKQPIRFSAKYVIPHLRNKSNNRTRSNLRKAYIPN